MPKRDRQTEVLTEIAAGAAIRRQIVFWLLAAVVFIAFVYVFSSILLPFVAGMVLAYFLDPVADRLERLGLSRTAATLVILALANPVLNPQKSAALKGDGPVVIVADNGRKYRFTKSDVVNSDLELVGSTVDFVVEASRPTKIILLQGSPWTVFGPAGRA